MNEYHIAVIHKDADSDFGVSFPDFPGCVTAGSTMEEARDMAAEALAAHLAVMAETGTPVPAPSKLSDVVGSPEYADCVFMVIPAPPPIKRTVRVNVSLDEGDLAMIDAAAKAHDMNRSEFLVHATRALETTESNMPKGRWEKRRANSGRFAEYRAPAKTASRK